MPSRRKNAACAAIVAAGLVWLAPGIAANSAATDPNAADPPTQQQIAAAVASLKADPNLAGERKMHMLRWAGQRDATARTPWDLPQWLKWFANLFSWLAEAGLRTIWVLCAIMAAVLIVYILRFRSGRAGARSRAQTVVPTHIRDLDIRPESLPDDIGAAANGLTGSGEYRAALALLYRGALSRLAHVHAVPIQQSTTEGECIDLAARILDPDRTAYVSRLVRVWQRAVYRGEMPEAAALAALCAEFAGALDPVSPATVQGLAA